MITLLCVVLKNTHKSKMQSTQQLRYIVAGTNVNTWRNVLINLTRLLLSVSIFLLDMFAC